MDQVKEDTDRDYFLDGGEAVKYGLIDKVIEKRV
jgi:ATP-dependent Clp protease, protease subunit